MAGSLLVPISVNAKVVTAATKVPMLHEAALADPATPLEAGIHLHWALPDALTRARLVEGSTSALFPGVPDLWVVTRFNPAPNTANPKRGSRSWVLDSQTGVVKDLAVWKPPAIRDLATIHAAPRMLRAASTPGWGIWDEKDGDFDPLTIAYYPACRTRLGFYDAVTDLAGKDGLVSYTVAGWYSVPQYDPLNQARDRRRLLDEWKLAHHEDAELYVELSAAAMVAPPSAGAGPVAWMPASVNMIAAVNPSEARVADIRRAAARGDSAAYRVQGIERMEAGFPRPPVVRQGPIQGTIGQFNQYRGPTSLLCHGSVVDVRLKGSTDVPTIKEVRVYPTVKRAMADIASQGGDEQRVDQVEMLLQNLEHQKGTAAGVLDLPGAVHALNFQSVPGKSAFFARLDVHRRPASPLQLYFDTAPEGGGYWPGLGRRAVAVEREPDAAAIPAAARYDAGMAAPSAAEIAAWVAAVRQAHATCAAQAAAQGTPIHPTLVRVHDRRPNAQSGQLGRTSDGSGSDSATWWLSIDDTAALGELRRTMSGNRAHLPHVEHLYEEPGPRWYRPWAPHVVVFGGTRSLRYGGDGRFRPDGYLDCRRSGEVLLGLAVGASGVAHGRDVGANLGALNVAGVPAEVRGLATESLLLDPESSSVLADLTVPRTEKPDVRARRGEEFRNAVRALWVLRDPKLTLALAASIDAVLPFGTLPSPVAVTPWADPRDALFMDTSYSHPRWPTAQDWTLEPEHVDPTVKNPLVTTTPAVEQFVERAPLTATIPKLLKSALFTNETLNAEGELVPKSNPPQNVESDTYDKADIISAPLIRFDETLLDQRNVRERAGALRVTRVRVTDVFGISREWTSGVAANSAAVDLTKKWCTALSPRLPYWARLRFRLQAPTGAAEASPSDPAVCGMLVPDFVEHTLEVFDGAGAALGQLVSDPPRRGAAAAGITLGVRFEPHPWLALGAGADPLSVVANPTLRSLVASIAAQPLTIPAGSGPTAWHETGLTAMLRVIDTIRGTLDPSAQSRDRRVRLMGEPILVLRARFELEGTGATKLVELAGDPPKLAPPLPAIPLRIGDVTRPDDGVLGCFVEGATPAEGRFAPVSAEAATGAIVNVFTGNVTGAGNVDLKNGIPATHPFVHGVTSTFQVAPNEPHTYVILADPRGALYATCGVLPRKKIVIPKEFIDAAVREIEPTIRTGPLLATVVDGQPTVMVPPPQVEGHAAAFVSDRDAAGYVAAPVSPVPPVGELPASRVTLTDGWMRVLKG